MRLPEAARCWSRGRSLHKPGLAAPRAEEMELSAHLLPICPEPCIDVCCSHPGKKCMMAGRNREAGMKQQMLRVGILDLTTN